MGKFFLDSRQVRNGVESEVSFFCALHKWMGRERRRAMAELGVVAFFGILSDIVISEIL